MNNNCETEVRALLEGMTALLDKHLRANEVEDPLFVGIHTGGAWVAEYLHQALKVATPLSSVSISFYRDDFTRISRNPKVTPSNLTQSVDGRHIILVDDVLYTGRTIRAALNELFDFGRPASVTLVVLVDRGGRELPIQADIVGTRMSLAANQQIKLAGPDNLHLELQQIA